MNLRRKCVVLMAIAGLLVIAIILYSPRWLNGIPDLIMPEFIIIYPIYIPVPILITTLLFKKLLSLSWKWTILVSFVTTVFSTLLAVAILLYPSVCLFRTHGGSDLVSIVGFIFAPILSIIFGYITLSFLGITNPQRKWKALIATNCCNYIVLFLVYTFILCPLWGSWA